MWNFHSLNHTISHQFVEEFVDIVLIIDFFTNSLHNIQIWSVLNDTKCNYARIN